MNFFKIELLNVKCGWNREHQSTKLRKKVSLAPLLRNQAGQKLALLAILSKCMYSASLIIYYFYF